MDIEGGGIQRLMSKEGFDGEQIRAVFIKMGAESVAERMAGKAVADAKLVFFCKDELVHGISDHMLLGLSGLREKPAYWFAKGKPVGGEDFQRERGENGIAVRTCFGMADMDPHGRTADILVTECTDLANAKAGGIHEGENCFVFEIGKGLDKRPDFFLRGDIGKVGIKSAHRELGVIPGLMQDVHGKEAEL